ncbi:MAG: HNH endonuclease, partial [Bacteroidia bacterium]
MRPIIKGAIPKNNEGLDIVFPDYKYARRYLIDRIGEYCSYCERKIEANLAVEHVQPKSLNPDLELSWDN